MVAVDLRPSLSVVIPVYNGVKDLHGCLTSVARAVEPLHPAEQRTIEVIVCDNWSDDGSHEVAEAFEMPVPYRVMRPERHEPNRTRNWRAGLAQTTADWMLMLHADDLMAPSGLVALLRAIKRPEAARATIIVGSHRTFDDPGAPGRTRPRWGPASLIPGGLLARGVLALHCPFVPFVLMRRSAYETVGGLDERWEIVQDWELWMRLSAIGDVLLVREEIGWWRVHPTSAKYRELNAREHVELSRVLAHRIPGLPAGPHARARRVALARAAIQLEDVDGDPSVWLGDGALPSVSAAREVLASMSRTVTVRMYALRALGVVRRLPLRERDVARQH